MRKLYISISWESRQNRCDKVAPVGTKRLLPVVTIAILNLSFRNASVAKESKITLESS